MTRRYSTLLAGALIAASSGTAAWAATPAEEMSGAARALIASLDDAQKARLKFEVKDPERMNWNIIPRDRKGLCWKDLSAAQRHLATALLASGLSQRGFVKATTIMSMEQILLEIEQGKGPRRDPENYYWSLFGEPSDAGTWGWRVEGHHCSVNFTVADGSRISSTPSMFGTNPGEVRQGPRKGLRVMGAEEDLGRALIQSLDAEQRKQAIFAEKALPEVVTLGAPRAARLDPPGIAAAKLNGTQKKLLRQVIEEYVRRARAEVADADLKQIDDAGFDLVTFGWAGSDQPGQGHYYRIQGPTFLLEYDNTQNNANHVHAAWREFQGDFGLDVIAEHYRSTPH